MGIDELIHKQLTGTATAEEEQKLSIWRTQSTQNELVYQQLASHWKGEHRRILQLKEDTWCELQRNMWAVHAVGPKTPIAEAKRPFGKRWMAIAASVVVLVAATVWLYGQLQAPAAPEPLAVAPQQLEKVAEWGQKLTVKLPDGTIVKLNGGSRLTFPEVFEGPIREVRLAGEAFFEVAHNPARPFVVRGNGLEVEVKGTSFNIENRSDNKQKIAVVTGLVQVRNATDALLVEPGQMAVGNDQGTIRKSAFSPEQIAWKDGKLIFEHVDFEDFTRKINYWYGFEVARQGKVDMGQGFTGAYDNPTLKAVMESFSFATGARYSIDYSTKTVKIW